MSYKSKKAGSLAQRMSILESSRLEPPVAQMNVSFSGYCNLENRKVQKETLYMKSENLTESERD